MCRLKVLGELPALAIVDFSECGGGDADGLSQFIDNMLKFGVVWHKTCKNSVDNQKVLRAEKKRKSDSTEGKHSPVKTRKKSEQTERDSLLCFFCDEVIKEGLRKAATFDLDKKVREAAKMIGDRRLLRKLSEGDMVAIDAVYHV